MAIPVTVTARPPYPRVQAHARHRRRTPGRCSNHSATAERVGKERRSACSCAPYQPSSAPPSKPIGGRHRHLPPSYPRTATVRVRGRPSWPDRSEDRPDGRPLYSVARRAPPCSWIARRACNSPPPWPIKGEASPQPRGETNSVQHNTPCTHSLILPQHLQPLHQGLGSHTSSPALLVLAPLQAPPVPSNIVPRARPCWTYGPLGRNQDKTLCHLLLGIDH
jgi:hypothetical protein